MLTLLLPNDKWNEKEKWRWSFEVSIEIRKLFEYLVWNVATQRNKKKRTKLHHWLHNSKAQTVIFLRRQWIEFVVWHLMSSRTCESMSGIHTVAHFAKCQSNMKHVTFFFLFSLTIYWISLFTSFQISFA